MRNNILRYCKVLGRRFYRPIKPLVSPLLKRIKIWQVVMGFLVIGLMGLFLNGWMVEPHEKLSWWPWSSKAHSQMAIMWFRAGNEVKALQELEKANSLMFLKTNSTREALIKAEEEVEQPKRIRREILSWEKIVEVKASYRDVWLRLAVLNYQIGEDIKAREALEMARYLDPNNEEVEKLGEIVLD